MKPVTGCSPHQAGRPTVASVEPDENPQRGFFGTDGEREPGRAVGACRRGARISSTNLPPVGLTLPPTHSLPPDDLPFPRSLRPCRNHLRAGGDSADGCHGGGVAG